MKTVFLAKFLFACSVVCTQAQQSQTLFSIGMSADAVSQQHRILAPAEHRSRMAQIGSVDATDFSIPLTVHLFEDVICNVLLERDMRVTLPGLEVWKGRVADSRFDHLPHYVNTVFVINRKTGKLVANFETQEGFFQILPTAQAGHYRIRDCKAFENNICSYVERPNSGNSALGGRAICGSACYDEVDENGRYILDVFAGYSDEAAVVAGDLEAHAQANIETVNMGLANSMVDMVYLRLVGTATTPQNPGIVTSVLSDAWVWFAPEIEALAPDFLAIFQAPTNAPGSAGGWGYMPGRISVNGVEWGTVFRHEFGHNVGGAHCYPDNESHLNGYNNGNWRTHLCGNDVNFYSTPLVNDNLGNPIGDEQEADMVRAWEERAASMATYAMHRLPYFEGDACVNQICLPDHWGGEIENITRVQFNTIDNSQSDPGWNCPSVTGYSDYTDIGTDVVRGESHSLTVTSNYSWEESTVRVWIDWNNDGIMMPGEQVADHTGNGPWSTMVEVPMDAALAPLRMRVRLQYGLEENSGPCNGTGYSSGETEDYTVNILTGQPTGIVGGQGEQARFSVFPNPASEILHASFSTREEGYVQLVLFNMLGERVGEYKRQCVLGDNQVSLDIRSLPAGVYTCELRTSSSMHQVAKLLKY